MISRGPDSEGESPPAHTRLHQDVQRWIWQQGWPGLRPVQEQAVDPILAGKGDVVITAPTAGGKTEAAFLPLFSLLAAETPVSIGVLCLSPLKALIDDQYDRLESIGRTAGVAVHRWHGDVDGGRKKKLLENPRGVLLITPESLEALFVLQASRLATMFSGLRAVVIDELHAFLGIERGRQLQSLLHRLELLLRRRIPRVGLSATLGDMSKASDFLRPGDGDSVLGIHGSSAGREVKLQIRGYRRPAPPPEDPDEGEDEVSEGELKRIESEQKASAGGESADLCAIADHLFDRLRGTDNLIFANSRSMVERLAALLHERTERERVPHEFLPHHGSLSRELRKDAESRLKSEQRPGNVLCTSTLEMGVDVGNVESVAQIGTPPSVASLLQRIGRSGRRKGRAAILRIYVSEDELTDEAPLQDRLHAELVQAVAMVEQMIAGWCEPPPDAALDLSTLVQQLLSLIAQFGSVRPHEAFQALCKSGPFAAVESGDFATLLRGLAEKELIRQMHEGSLVLGLEGEKLVEHYSFYAAFAAADEWRIRFQGKTLGQVPVVQPLAPGSFLVFAGRRWMVMNADASSRVVEVAPSAAGRPPRFGGSGALVHGRVREAMFDVYRGSERPAYVDAVAGELLEEARGHFQRAGLANRALVQDGGHCLVFPWSSDAVHATLTLLLRRMEMKVTDEGLALRVSRISAEDLAERFEEIADEGVCEGPELAAEVANKLEKKYDPYLPEELLSADWASRHLDPEGAHAAAQRLARGDALRPPSS